DPIAGFPATDRRVDLVDDACQLVAEDRWWNDHARVVASLEYFQVRSAGQSRFNGNAKLAFSERLWFNLLHPDQFLTVENGCFHRAKAMIRPHARQDKGVG